MKATTAILALMLAGLYARGDTPIETIIARVKRVQTPATEQGVIVSTSVSNITQEKSGFAYRLVTFTEAPAGTVTIQIDHRIPFAALVGTSSRIEDTPFGTVKFIVEAPIGKKPFSITAREYSTGYYAKNTSQGESNDLTASYFGFVFATKSEAEEFQKIWAEFLSRPIVQQAAHAVDSSKHIIGSTKTEVDASLTGWSCRKDSRSTQSRTIYVYIKDVELQVAFQDGKAVGVAVIVIDKLRVGFSPLPQKRFDELVALIGGGQPKAIDVLRDASGIHEFSVGDADESQTGDDFFALANSVRTQQAKLSEKQEHIILQRPQVTYSIPLASCDWVQTSITDDTTFAGARVRLTIPMKASQALCEEFRDGTDRPEVAYLPKARLTTVDVFFATRADAEDARTALPKLIAAAPEKQTPPPKSAEDEEFKKLLNNEEFFRKLKEAVHRDGFR